MSQEHYLFQLALYAVTALNFLITALNFRRCTITSKYSGKAKYFKCANPLRGIAVYIEMRDQNTPETLQLCEVEVFQTTTSEQKQSEDMYSTFKVQHERGTDHEFFIPCEKNGELMRSVHGFSNLTIAHPSIHMITKILGSSFFFLEGDFTSAPIGFSRFFFSVFFFSAKLFRQSVTYFRKP